MAKDTLRNLWKKDTDAAIQICLKRIKLPATDSFPVDVFFNSPKPSCTEKDCDGLVLLPREKKTFRLAPVASCILCGRRYKVIGIEERIKQEDL